MPPSSKQLEIDARWVFRRAFLLFFLAFQLMAWHRAGRVPGRPPGLRLMAFLFTPWATIHSLGIALAAGGLLTLAAVVFIRVCVRPLLSLWLSPPVDPSGALFHMSPGETILASVSGRRLTGWRWRRGSLSVTDRRFWFFPAAYEEEPWSVSLDDLAGVEVERSTLAEMSPIRNFPLPLHLRGRRGQNAVFATADPDAVLTWLRSFERLERDGDAKTRK
jgi:hypothetical protein